MELARLYQEAHSGVVPNSGLVKFPIGFIIGNPRSGSTILLQILALSGSFAYPSNLITRFSFAPEFGARIQQMLFDERFDPDGTFCDLRSHCDISLVSDLGRSQGVLAPNEFYHFFRRFFPCRLPKALTPQEKAAIDLKKMQYELQQTATVFQKPLVSKGYMFQYHLAYFAKRMPNVVWIRVKRNPVFVMQSIYRARMKLGDLRAWWSVMPPEYETLAHEDIFTQIAGQVFYTEKALDQGFAALPKKKQLIVLYEKFCKNPRFYLDCIQKCLGGMGSQSIENGNHMVPVFLQNTNHTIISEIEINRLKDAYRGFTGEIE